MKKDHLPFILLGVFIAGWFCNFLFNHVPNRAEGESVQVREDSPAYKYINPLIYIDNSQKIFKELDTLKNPIEDLINKEMATDEILQAGFYFRDLSNGAWTGVREDDNFNPASMLKVADLIVYLHMAEDNPEIINSNLYYDQKNNTGQNYPPEHLLPTGYYSVHQLLAQAIIESDNAAHLTLKEPREKELSELYRVLRLPLSPANPNESFDFMSPRDISLLFRALYNSSYLTDSFSDQALELLSKTNFTKGLNQGIPSTITLAHKFGEYTTYFINPDKEPEYQLHDCGLVYYPDHPYLICVMTRGNNLQNLEKLISDISKTTYDYVAKKK